MRKTAFVPILLAVAFAQVGCASGAGKNREKSSSHADQTQFHALAATDSQSDVEKQIVAKLQSNHYNKVALNDAFSNKLFHAYLDDLDGSHSVLLQSDIQRLKKRYADRLDDQLKAGDTEAIYAIFNAYQKRRLQIDHWALATVKHGIDSFNIKSNRSLTVDRSEAPWPADAAARRALWNKRIANQIIRMRLNGTEPDKIHKRLTNRYENKLNRLSQVTSSDAFSIFMHAYTHSYDPHTDYFSPERYENFNIDMNLQLQGIGAELRMKNGYAELVRLIPGGPAMKSHKLNPADRVLAVGQGSHGDFTDVVGMRLDQTVQLIRGKAGSTVRLRVSAPDNSQIRTVSLTRAKIKLKDQAADQQVMHVSAGGDSSPVGLITLPSFYNGTAADVKHALKVLKKDKVNGVVLDLRNNGGGALGEAMKLIGLFMNPAPGLQIKDADGRVQVLGDGRSPAFYSGPLVVLVNRLSASASEIVAAALQDYGRALIVGSNTFGKGTVQTVLPLSKGELKLTEAKFYRVTGDSTQDRGVTPAIKFPSPIDPKRIGESALPNALPWDRIPPTRYPHSNAIENVVAKLKREHAARADKTPNFVYLVRRIELARKESKRKTVSLDIDKRQKRKNRLEQKSLALANAHRKALGKPPFDNYKAFENAQSDGDDHLNAVNTNQDDDESADAYEKEAARILLDMARAVSAHANRQKAA